MSLDLYQPCPCGLGKNIKFCCRDLAHELESIMKKIDGSQLQAADAELDRMLAEHPQREAFWALKVTLQYEQGDVDGLREISGKFLAVAPNNPIALASDAILAATEPPEEDHDPSQPSGPCRRAVDQLQAALENSPSGISIQIYDSLGLIADRLMAESHWLAAREHLAFQVLLDRDNAQVPYGKLIQISRNPSTSLLLRQDLTISPCPPELEFSGAYQEAVDAGARGLWRSALNQLEDLAEKHCHSTIFKAISILACRLAENAKAVVAWRKFADCDAYEISTDCYD